jgi:hypothetical protein
MSLLALAALLGAATGGGLTEPHIAMNVEPAYSQKWGSFLKVTLTLESPDPVLVSPRDLPWGSPYNALVVVAAPPDGHGEVLPRVSPFDEPIDPPPDLALQPGKPISGEVYLSGRFHGDRVARALSAGDLLIFWAFRLRLSDGRLSNRVGGWALAARPRDKR